jgi:hypothetical protein
MMQFLLGNLQEKYEKAFGASERALEAYNKVGGYFTPDQGSIVVEDRT